jgi:hypothetical protein
MSSISAGTTSSTALVATADTSGALVLQTNNGTTALTLSTAQNATFAGTLATAAKGITAASLPAGTVLQVQSAYLTSTTQLTSSGALHELSTSLRITFTPVSASSTLYLECYGSYVSPQSNNLYYGAFYDVTNAAYVNLPPASGSRQRVHWFKRTTSFDPNDADDMNFNIPVANTSTTARTYTVYHGSEGAVAQFLVSSLSSSAGVTMPLMFKITEVAA